MDECKPLRVGRTARAGKTGTALTFMEEADRKIIKAVSKRGRGLHSSTFQLNLSRFGDACPCSPV